MTVQSRKREAGAVGGRPPARPVVLVMTVVPMVKSAGLAAQAGARGAATWAAPRVNGARAWTAPRIEQSGLVIRDDLAPRIHAALVATARRVDVPAPSPARSRWPRAVAGTAMLVAAGAAVTVVLRRRKQAGTGEPDQEAAAAPDTGPRPVPDGQPDTGLDGSRADVSGPPTTA